ncbi:putative phosphoribosyltransferase [Antricoccus suffuscus]|uniref:Putative phosphoribosyltransferase n=1 Tax=Antricoccus suffuscus TaxID=1629062 RepID=A0A2T0ZW05_9ACTN|nr:phosphoribosyltransferase family protein [Antricoccus suffuscus]PRZ40532.1 putative phosphoribosyltransferase [Antricoccus suffuscus]
MAMKPESTTYADRTEAGRLLSQKLKQYAGLDDVLVLGLPRGGVPVAAVVADAIGAALDVLVVRKLGLPEQPELAMGAIAAVGGSVTIVRDEFVLDRARVTEATFDEVFRAELAELRRREVEYRGERLAPPIRDHRVIVIDDGLATGSTMRAALTLLRQQHPQELVAAVPVGARDSREMLDRLADSVLCLHTPEHFGSVGRWYEKFPQLTDREVQRFLTGS